MDRNNLIGFVLIFIILFVWMRMNAPTPEQLAEERRIQDSLRQVQLLQDSTVHLPSSIASPLAEVTSPPSDSLKQARFEGTFGPFAGAASGEEREYKLENEHLQITFSNKGGRIKEVWVKEYQKVMLDEDHKEYKVPLKLLEDPKNKFEYYLPVSNIPSGSVNTADLFFEAVTSGNSISFRANAGNGRYFEQKYTLQPGSFSMDYELSFNGLNDILSRETEGIKLNWVNYLDKLERNTEYERSYSTTYFKPVNDDIDYCNCRGDDEETVEERVKWVSNSNQFFNSALIAETSFTNANLVAQMYEEENEDLKKLQSEITIPYERGSSSGFKMKFYTGPNEFKTLKSYGHDFEDIIPFGWSVFGTVNRWFIRPIFTFLSEYIGSKGIVILVLTLLVKLLLYPLTYKMLYSQSKMGALKPQMEKLTAKFGDDAQKKQMETMKLYREFGVSPFGGCMPMVLQMPIWFALYRFFPASIEFRQANFLWASDLSSFDVFANLPFTIPFYGDHVSLFTLLWAATTVIYTYYNTKHMDLSINPMMKYMQYGMPVMFLFFFNNFASGLTCYLLFSNLMNITQTIVTKNYIIDQEKIKAELEENRKKPKKRSAFQERLQKALAEQQRIQQEREAGPKKKKKKK